MKFAFILISPSAYSIKNLGYNDSIRSSAARAWLYPADEQRPSLTVLTSHVVTRILFATSPNNIPRAIGVEVASSDGNGSFFRVSAHKEVILAAGSLAVNLFLGPS
jgi:choline dehydrogenase